MSRVAHPKGNSETRFTGAELERLVDEVWKRGREVPGADPEHWRQDACGAWIRRELVGHADSDFGWKIESVADEGAPLEGLLRPFHCRNDYDRVHRRVVYRVRADDQLAAARIAGLPCIAGPRPPEGAIPQVGARDPRLETSPIFDDCAEVALDQASEATVCYFNGAGYRLGALVMSGEQLLRCAGKGVWVRMGKGQPR
jgi:hypothetical protein